MKQNYYLKKHEGNNRMNVKELFAQHEDEQLKFDDVKNKKSLRYDLHAFILLAELFPSNKCIVSGASHDAIYLGIGDKEMGSLTSDNALDLMRCGVMYDTENCCLYMFV